MSEPEDVINLKILSPSTEVEGGISLPSLPIATTVHELRQKIQDAAPSRPATERMRLIYRGRVVANNSDRMVDIFGADNIRENKDQSLHLVLRELPQNHTAPSLGSQASNVPPNPFRAVPGTPQGPPQSPLQTNPFRALPQAGPTWQPQGLPLPHHHHPQPQPQPQPHHHHHHHPVNVLPQGSPVALPPQQQHLRQLAQFQANLQARARAQDQLLAHAQRQAQNDGQSPVSTAEGASETPSREGAQAAPRPPASAPPALPQNTTRTIRQEGIGPNGERWTVTWNNTNMTIPINANQQPFATLVRPLAQTPPAVALSSQRVSPLFRNQAERLSATRTLIDQAQRELRNVRTLLWSFRTAGDPTSTPRTPPWRVEYIRQLLMNVTGNLDMIDGWVASLFSDPVVAQNHEVVSLQQSVAQLRSDVAMYRRHMEVLLGDSVHGAAATLDLHTTTAAQTQTAPAFQSEFFILSSPRGPVGVLFDQRGTYTTSQIHPTLPLQSFSQQFVANRQAIAGIGQQIAQNAAQMPNLQNLARVVQAQQPPVGGQPAAEQPQNPAPNPNQAQPQPQNPAQPALAVPEQDRVGLVAGHLWLLFKLACFVYFFAGGGGWRRPVALGMIAGVVYLAQIGIFDRQFALVRRHFEALLPLAERAIQPPNQANANGQGAGNRRVDPARNLSPQEAAHRLVQQRQDQRVGWIRETMRSTERAFAIFIASLWPGIGERMVQAQEERERAERAAEEERQRLRNEEEARRQEEAGKDAEKAESEDTEMRDAGNEEDLDTTMSDDQPSASAKGKERAVEGVDGGA